MVGMSTPSDAVSSYILAKDGNRPFLVRRAVAEDAELETVVKTDAISFPSSAKVWICRRTRSGSTWLPARPHTTGSTQVCPG